MLNSLKDVSWMWRNLHHDKTMKKMKGMRMSKNAYRGGTWNIQLWLPKDKTSVVAKQGIIINSTVTVLGLSPSNGWSRGTANPKTI